jgi:hypothetical protein
MAYNGFQVSEYDKNLDLQMPESTVHFCQICFCGFSIGSKSPMSLPCGHTLCFQCVKAMHKYSSVMCPFDKIKHRFAAPTNVPKNFYLLDLLAQ